MTQNSKKTKHSIKGILSIRNLGIGKEVYIGEIDIPETSITDPPFSIRLQDHIAPPEIGTLLAEAHYFIGSEENCLHCVIAKHNVYFEINYPKTWKSTFQATGRRLKTVNKLFPRDRFVQWSAYLRII